MNLHLNNLRLINFRSYSDFVVELASGVNIIVGPNASGKTNLLEAIILIAGDKSYRATTLDLVKQDQDWSKLEASLAGGNKRIIKIKSADLTKKTFEINDKIKKRLSFEDKIPIVLFEPENMRLLTGSPENRRNFIDDILISSDNNYAKYLNNYKRLLLQRNKLLKNNSSSKDMFVWNIKLAEYGGKLVEKRLLLINKINSEISQIYSEIANKKTKVEIIYNTNIKLNNYETSLLSNLEQSFEQDIIKGYTSSGPHREDFEVILNEKPAKISASRGETRTLVLSFKLIEKNILEIARQIKPIILLDDVFSELDGLRRKSLTNYLKDYQTIITTTDADLISKNFAQDTNLISL